MIDVSKYKLNNVQCLAAYEKMLLLRRFEEKCGQFYGMGLIAGFCHLYIGQEAVITAVDMVKLATDNTITSYRDHAHIILSGIEPKYVLAELMGKRNGCSAGKGGSMHMFNVAGKFYGGHGIVGAQVPIGTGIAFAEKYLESQNICFTFLGDGAINQGQVYEAMNMASLWKLPVVYIIENNEYSMGTSVQRSTTITDLYKKGASFGIDGYQVDGMDIEAMYSVVRQVTEFVRTEQRPIIIEAKTYRYRGHSMSDPATYRTKNEVEQYKDRDPLIIIKNRILEVQDDAAVALKTIDQKIKKIVQESVDFAEQSPLPEEAVAYTSVYA